MRIRIPRSHATVQALHSGLQHADRKAAGRLVRRTTVLIDLLGPQGPGAVLRERWGLSPACLYAWQKAFVRRGMDSLVARHRGGRPEKLTPKQNNRWVEVLEAGPLVGGLETACGNSVLIRGLIWRACGVLYTRHQVCTLRPNWGGSFQKARVVSAHLDAAKRLAGRQDQGPAMVRAAQRGNGLLLLEDEASCAPWGSRSDPWARRGPQPEVPPRGKRKGDKGLGAIAYFSGRWFSQGLEGRGNSDSSPGCLQMMRAQTPAPLFLIHDGARSHTSAATQAFLAAHHDRITAPPFPAYSPDDNPSEYLWKKMKQRAPHNKYFKEFAALTISVEKALAYCATHPDEGLGLFGCYCEESGLDLKQAA